MLVLDTSYLVEVYRVPGHFDRVAHAAIKARLAVEIERDSRLYVPVPVVFELANHVAGVNAGGPRRKLAKQVAGDVRTSVARDQPWIVVPTKDHEILRGAAQLLETLDHFANALAEQGIGLSDAAVIAEARRLKAKYAGLGLPVHIWTRDRVLKAHEPDAEPNPFV